ncbi:response regulator transcription factor [Erysipelothrix sp. HDW6B]|uniref:LytR/AlgR family response regulator transcription factor n=1 Tax=Erysipelothrix TaxID=1647 RepID=UPI0013592F23|nr:MULTISPECIES: LytTR family DNA-binding domain-containing protein [Erysipelothrix]QIK86572.1 response regulator transcription factor [Erysipelothrix sp. HDW6B]
MFKIAIVDDNLQFRDQVFRLISESSDTLNIATIDTYESSEAYINRSPLIIYNLAILDIEMPGLDGVSLAKQIQQTEHATKIIFLTSYVHYMKDAFGLNVHKYIMKEDVAQELIQAIEEIRDVFVKSKSKKISLKTNNKEIQVDVDDIIIIEYIDRHPYVYTESHKIKVINASLTDIYKRLDSRFFVRPNSGTIINLLHVDSVSSKSLEMRSFDKEISISRGRYKDIIRVYTEYLMLGDTL